MCCSADEIEEALKELDRFALDDDALAAVTGGVGPDIWRNETEQITPIKQRDQEQQDSPIEQQNDVVYHFNISG